MARGRLSHDNVLFADHPVTHDATAANASANKLEECTEEVAELLKATALLRHPAYAAPESLTRSIRNLLDSGQLALLQE